PAYAFTGVRELSADYRRRDPQRRVESDRRTEGISFIYIEGTADCRQCGCFIARLRSAVKAPWAASRAGTRTSSLSGSRSRSGEPRRAGAYSVITFGE